MLLVQRIAFGNRWSIFPLSTPLPLFPHSKLLPMFFKDVTNDHKAVKSKGFFSNLILTHHTAAVWLRWPSSHSKNSPHITNIFLIISLIGSFFFFNESLLQFLFHYLTLKIKIFSQFLVSNQCSFVWLITSSPPQFTLLPITYECFCTILAEPNSYDRDHIVHKTENVYYVSLKRKRCRPLF